MQKALLTRRLKVCRDAFAKLRESTEASLQEGKTIQRVLSKRRGSLLRGAFVKWKQSTEASFQEEETTQRVCTHRCKVVKRGAVAKLRELTEASLQEANIVQQALSESRLNLLTGALVTLRDRTSASLHAKDIMENACQLYTHTNGMQALLKWSAESKQRIFRECSYYDVTEKYDRDTLSMAFGYLRHFQVVRNTADTDMQKAMCFFKSRQFSLYRAVVYKRPLFRKVVKRVPHLKSTKMVWNKYVHNHKILQQTCVSEAVKIAEECNLQRLMFHFMSLMRRIDKNQRHEACKRMFAAKDALYAYFNGQVGVLSGPLVGVPLAPSSLFAHGLPVVSTVAHQPLTGGATSLK
jgi:hypothetical protein